MEVLTVSADVPEPPVTEAGTKAQVGADATTGVTLHDRSTCPVNPLRAVMVMVAVADPPATTEAGVRADDAIE